jgi:hypothetical protein
MSWLEFSIELIKALIWPIVFVIVLIVIRKPLAGLVPYLKRLKLGELEAEFDKTVEQIKADLDQDLLRENREAALLIPGNEIESLTGLAEIAPNAAVLQAWKKVEQAARELVASRGYELDYHVAAPYRLLENMLKKAGLAETKKIKVFDDLRILRNKIAHAAEFEISPAQAGEYVTLATSLRAYFLLAAEKNQRTTRPAAEKKN